MVGLVGEPIHSHQQQSLGNFRAKPRLLCVCVSMLSLSLVCFVARCSRHLHTRTLSLAHTTNTDTRRRSLTRSARYHTHSDSYRALCFAHRASSCILRRTLHSLSLLSPLSLSMEIVVDKPSGYVGGDYVRGEVQVAQPLLPTTPDATLTVVVYFHASQQVYWEENTASAFEEVDLTGATPASATTATAAAAADAPPAAVIHDETEECTYFDAMRELCTTHVALIRSCACACVDRVRSCDQGGYDDCRLLCLCTPRLYPPPSIQSQANDRSAIAVLTRCVQATLAPDEKYALSFEVLLPQFSYATFHSTTGNITYTLKGSLDNTREPVRERERET